MNRRHFLSTLAAAVAGSNYDPERALWTPGAKLISIPKPTLVAPEFSQAEIDEAYRHLNSMIDRWNDERPHWLNVEYQCFIES